VETIITDPEQQEMLMKLRAFLAGKTSKPNGYQVPEELDCWVAGRHIPMGATIWCSTGILSVFYVTLEAEDEQLTVRFGRAGQVTMSTKSLGGPTIAFARPTRGVSYSRA